VRQLADGALSGSVNGQRVKPTMADAAASLPAAADYDEPRLRKLRSHPKNASEPTASKSHTAPADGAASSAPAVSKRALDATAPTAEVATAFLDHDDRHGRKLRLHAKTASLAAVPVLAPTLFGSPLLPEPVPEPDAAPGPKLTLSPAQELAAAAAASDLEREPPPLASPAIPVSRAPLTEAEALAEAELLRAIVPAAGSPAAEPAASPDDIRLPEPPSGKPALASAAVGGDAARVYRLQIGSYLSEAAATRGWRKIVHQHEDLSDWQPLIAEYEAKDRKQVYYRLRIGEYDTRAEARTACEELRARDLDCLVMKTRVQRS
jgi:hypothetical protein